MKGLMSPKGDSRVFVFGAGVSKDVAEV